MQVIDPSTGEVKARYALMDERALEAALARSAAAFRAWRETSFAERARLLERVASSLRARADGLALRMATEMGKPLAQGRAEVEKCAWVCEHYAARAADYLASEPIDVGADRALVTYRPLGPVLAIMPWNFPFWQVFRQAAPALMAGDTVLLKHAENVPGCAEDLAALFADAGAPDGVLESLRIERARVARVIADARVRAVTLTGSARAGRAVAAQAGAALKKTVLELGGSDPYVVLADADLERAADACVASRLINAGQSCIAAKRFVVVRDVHDRFVELVVERMARARVGDPREPTTEVGPLAREDLRATLDDQVRRSIAAGAEVALGCEVPDGPGFFYPPSVLTAVTPGMAAFDEELFGPVAAVVEARDEAEAVVLANASPYGLGAAVFTRDPARGRRLAEHALEAGTVAVGAFVRSDPRLPFGGIGDSGYGRELGRHGIHELVNVKTIFVSVS
ncbi:MAG: NAD-dependent succinate-semialdehyde dehydrogenase [Sandaracinaceae bacterium]|nr:NAD-dependent succinate-semialdehyde dehydrogenase [Sandaracinaceae bacterium]